jgi:hypothetical protein
VRQSLSATGVGLAIIVLTTLWLSHLASGITIVTHSPAWQGWALAVGIDCGFILMELACITTVADKVRRVVERYARPAIAGTLAGSAMMNAFAFASDASTLQMQIAGSVIGLCHPDIDLLSHANWCGTVHRLPREGVNYVLLTFDGAEGVGVGAAPL